MPDITIFLDLPPEDAFKRKGGRDEGDRMELQSLEFHSSSKVVLQHINLC